MRVSQSKPRHFAGHALLALRKSQNMGQAVMAARLGISVSYLSQLENDDRPITSKVAEALGRAFPFDWSLPDAAVGNRIERLQEAITGPLFADLPAPDQVLRIAEQQPDLVDRFIRLSDAYRRGEAERQMLDETLSSSSFGGGRLPWEEVRDWFHAAGNYIDQIDRAAEALFEELEVQPLTDTIMTTKLKLTYGIDTLFVDTTDSDNFIRQFDKTRGVLKINRALLGETQRFQLAIQLGAMAFSDSIRSVASSAPISDEARRLLGLGLANYAAGALLMPYGRIRASARQVRHDVDRLCRQFGTSFEQVCHRLSNLQRPGARGLPFFFCRVDMAGNITKRHSATRLQFARFGGACPLWIVHEAAAIPDRILVQLAEAPDGVRYVSMAKGLVKPSGSYTRSPRRFAVALGCEVEHAKAFVYADELDFSKKSAATPIGVSCRLCPRKNCDQRAFPPADRLISMDPDRRRTVPYEVLG